MAKSIRNLESLIDKGENPNGFTAQTANGTAKATGTGWNRNQPYTMPEAEPDGGAWRGGRTNRTGE